MGIIAGLGRGMPGRPPAGGRGGRASSSLLVSGRGAGRRPIPWLGANGLLPGRGAPGRPTGRGAGAFGVAGSDADAAGGSSAGGSVVSGGARDLDGLGDLGGRGLGGRLRAGPRRGLLGGRLGLGGGGLGRGVADAAAGSAGAGAASARLLGRLLGLGLGGLGRLLGEQGVAVLLLELHLDRELHGRGGRLDELAHLFQLLENFLALDAVRLGEFMDSGLGHVSLFLGPDPRPAVIEPLGGVHAHCEVLIECS